MFKEINNKLVLAVLCIVVGMTPLVTLINTLESGKHMIKSRFEGSLINMDLKESSVVYEDIIKLSEKMSEVTEIIPISTDATSLHSYKNSSTIRLRAVAAGYAKYAGLKMIKGKFISKGNLDNNTNVIVIDDLMADELFGTTDVVGRTLETSVKVVELETTIIGVCKRLDTSEGQLKQEKAFAYIPISLLDNNLTNYEIQETLLLTKGLQIDEIKAHISYFLKLRGIEIDTDKIQQVSQNNLVAALVDKNKGILIAMSVLWLIASMIGLISILLSYVDQNKKYYGLLMFYGSGAHKIRDFIYLKAYNIALLSGAISIGIGITASLALSYFLNMPFHVSLNSLTLGFVLPLVLSISAAIYPAYIASVTDVNRVVWQFE